MNSMQADPPAVGVERERERERERGGGGRQKYLVWAPVHAGNGLG